MRTSLLIIVFVLVIKTLHAQNATEHIAPLTQQQYRFSVHQGSQVNVEGHFRKEKRSTKTLWKTLLPVTAAGTPTLFNAPKHSEGISSKRIMYGFTVTPLYHLVRRSNLKTEVFLQLKFFNQEGDLIKTSVKHLNVSPKGQTLTFSEEAPTDGEVEITLGNGSKVGVNMEGTHFQFKQKKSASPLITPNTLNNSSTASSRCFWPECGCWIACGGQTFTDVEIHPDGSSNTSNTGDGHSDWVSDGGNNDYRNDNPSQDASPSTSDGGGTESEDLTSICQRLAALFGKTLNDCECQWAQSSVDNAADAWKIYKNSKKADKFVDDIENRIYWPNGDISKPDNDARNAFKHAYWQALNACSTNGYITRVVAGNHEKCNGSIGPATQQQYNMDTHNNEQGIQASFQSDCSEEDIISKVLESYYNHKLIKIEGCPNNNSPCTTP